MKKLVRLAALFFFSTLLVSQSLVDVAKKEQERREKFKGKNVKVVTNADLRTLKKGPAITTAQAETVPEESTAGQEPAAPAEAGTQTGRPGGASAYATGVVGPAILVDNPEAALNAPDENYAEVAYMGQLDLEINVQDGPGDDIAVFARVAGLEEAVAAFEEEGIPMSAWPGGMFSYGVLALGEDGEWQALGRGAGESLPETFDLAGLKETKRIRIIFKPDNNPVPPNQPLQLAVESFTMGIDAVEALN